MENQNFHESFHFAFGEDSSDPRMKVGDLFPEITISSLGPEDVKKIYYERIWLKSKLDKIESFEVSKKTFDFSTTLGPRRTNIILQRSLNDGWDVNVVVDGKIQSKEVSLINEVLQMGEEDFLLNLFCHRIASFYEVFSKNDNIRDTLRWVFR